MRLYNYLLNVSIVTRWLIFIVPILGILWIPGILSFTKFPNAKVSYYYTLPIFGCITTDGMTIDMGCPSSMVVDMAQRCLGRYVSDCQPKIAYLSDYSYRMVGLVSFCVSFSVHHLAVQ